MPAILHNVPCRKCGNLFRQSSHQQHFCSDDCRLSKLCVVCGKQYRAASNRNRFCSQECRFGVNACVVCGQKFRKSSNSRGEYCSQQCFFKSRQELRSRSCLVCGGSFHVRSPGVKQKTCGSECADKLRKQKRGNCLKCGRQVGRPQNRYCSKTCALGSKNLAYFGNKHPEGAVRPAGNGYMVAKVRGKWMLQHRHVMEQTLGRALEKHERVHHKNGNRSDNRPENLELWKVTKKDPAGVRAADYHCPGCRCFEKRE